MLNLITINVLAILLIMLLAWFLYLLIKNPGLIDMVWSIAIMISGLIALFSTQIHITQILSGFLLIIWGVRLSGHLFFTRILPGQIDKRYLTLSSDWKISKALGFLFNYQLQGLLAILIALPFWWIRDIIHLTLLVGVGLMVSILGIIGETIADYQLHQYQMHHETGVCDSGLWRYSRHPNYFSEWLVWVGFALVASQQPWGLLAWCSPLLLLSIMCFITGPITEQHSLKARGEAFKAYQDSTSMFFPLPPKK